MDLQPVDIGTAPNDGTGDEIRDAFAKLNQNFEVIKHLTGAGAVSDFGGFVVLDSEAGLSTMDEIVASMIGDGQVSNAKLANVATATLKGRVAGGSGAPTDLSIAEAKQLLDLDHMTALTGVAAAAENLGAFTGPTLGSTLTIKAALQALATALEALVAASPRVAFVATSAKSVLSGSSTVLDDLDAISVGTLGNSSLSNGVFTVGTGDAGWYEARLQYKPVDTGSNFTRVGGFIVPTTGVPGNKTERMPTGLPVWAQTPWAGNLAEGESLTFSGFQVNDTATARGSDSGTCIVVRRASGPAA